MVRFNEHDILDGNRKTVFLYSCISSIVRLNTPKNLNEYNAEIRLHEPRYQPVSSDAAIATDSDVDCLRDR